VNAFFNKANKYTCLVIVPITVSVIIFSGPIAKLLYGSVYTSAALFLSLSCSVYLLSIIGSLTLLSVFNGLGKTRLTMNMTLINFVLLLVLSPLLAAVYGVVGVIVASLVSATTASVYAAVAAKRTLKIKFNFNYNLRIYLISVLAALPPLGLLWFTKLSFVVVLFVGAVMYLCVFVTLMPLMKIVNVVELETLIRVTGRLPLVKVLAKTLFNYQRKILLLRNYV
jgi:O-antigen/teichoic acid export membrane protein